jgi:flavin reductase (DIM6/NTAB) family NADH-FMN oxidoreductase RutF
VVHALARENLGLARLFGEETGDNIDKFSHTEWHTGPGGRSVVLDECPRWFAGEVVARYDPGDHLGLLVAPFAAECRGSGPQLGFQSVRDLEPGHPA